MKWEKETLNVYDAASLSEACNAILSKADMVTELEDAFDFCRKIVEEYRLWLAYQKPNFTPLKYRQMYPHAKIWTIEFKEKTVVDEKREKPST